MTSPPPTPPPTNPSPTTTTTTAKPTKFRFKSHSKRPRDPSSSSDPSQSSKHPRPSHRHHHHHHRHHHRRPHHRSRPPPDDPSLYDDTHLPNASSEKYLDPDTAFRESLFDALADDEGAAFWEGVYGQPIHTYSPYRRGATSPNDSSSNNRGGGGDGGTEDLDRMTDEEYTAYVRSKMWEKSHAYVLEERAKREEERAKRKEREAEERKRAREWREGLDGGLEEVARRREEKKKGGDAWRRVWEGYLRGWDELKSLTENIDPDGAEDGKSEGKGKEKSIRDRMAWPVKSGRFKDVGRGTVEEFLKNAPRPVEPGGELDFLGVLKVERVRWHPDKIQQRLGSLGIDEGTMKAVTAVFQVIDAMWSAERERKQS